MNKKGVFVLFILLLISLPLALADTNDDKTKVDKAYACVKEKTDGKSDLSLQEAIFSILARGSNSKAEKKLDDEKNTNCWPKSACNLRDTSQALMAYKTLGKSTDDIKSYILSKNASATGLNWFLVVDISNKVTSSCTLNYAGSSGTISIGEDMKISGNPGTCFSLAQDGYWLQISPTCLDYKFSISCDQDFVTTLLYQETGSDTIFLSSETKGAASSGQVEQSINAKCFKIGGQCDYEGSLWATLALSQVGQDVSSFIPYLAATSSNYPDLFPDAFLYKLSGSDDYYSDVAQAQKSSQYWQAPNTRYNKFYDTALGLLALQGKNSLESTNAQKYLLSIQGSSGCWNNDNLRDTAFLLYAGWPNQISSSLNNNTGGVVAPLCASGGYSCVSSQLQCSDAGGTVKTDYSCPGALYCCTASPAQQTCTQKAGKICSAGQVCSGQTASALDGSCCLGTCTTSTDSRSQCEIAGGSCYSSCTADEESTSESCSAGLVCCMAKESTSSGSSTTWIIILILLIALVALGIIFRNKLRVMFFKLRRPGSISSTPIMARRPPYPPSFPGGLRPAPPRQFSPAQRAPARVQPNDEMEETLRKLREMSK